MAILYNRRLLFLVSEDWYFWSHRRQIAAAAIEEGYDVWLATQFNSHSKAIREMGIHPVQLKHFRRRIQNPLKELLSLQEIYRIYNRVRPDIIHHVAMKPIVFGSVGAFLTPQTSIINAVAGMGSLFVSSSILHSAVKFLLMVLLRGAISRRKAYWIVQNDHDRQLLETKWKIQSRWIEEIPGSGVDPGRFRFLPEPKHKPIVLLPARLLWDKGIREFTHAAMKIQNDGIDARFVIVGRLDTENPSSVPLDWIRKWENKGVIEWWGFQEHMEQIFPQAAVVCLPSYREGLPKALVEAAACGRPTVAFDVPGCREIIRNGENGFLVQGRNGSELAKAIKTLLGNRRLRATMGRIGRRLVIEAFSDSIVTKKTIGLYKRLIFSAK